MATTGSKSQGRHAFEAVAIGLTIGALVNYHNRLPLIRYPMAYPLGIAAVVLGKTLIGKMSEGVVDDIDQVYARLKQPIDIELSHNSRPFGDFGARVDEKAH